MTFTHNHERDKNSHCLQKPRCPYVCLWEEVFAPLQLSRGCGKVRTGRLFLFHCGVSARVLQAVQTSANANDWGVRCHGCRRWICYSVEMKSVRLWLNPKYEFWPIKWGVSLPFSAKMEPLATLAPKSIFISPWGTWFWFYIVFLKGPWRTMIWWRICISYGLKCHFPQSCFFCWQTFPGTFGCIPTAPQTSGECIQMWQVTFWRAGLMWRQDPPRLFWFFGFS